MRKLILLALAAASPMTAASDTETDAAKRAMDAFVGNWKLVLAADESTFGSRGGAGTGTMNCSRGPMDAWVDCVMDSVYEGMGRYTMKTVIHRAGDGFGAFVTNSFGGGRSYAGHWLGEDSLVFIDRQSDMARKWPYQRTTYTLQGSDSLSFAVEVSSDGMRYLPHSRGTYHRQ